MTAPNLDLHLGSPLLPEQIKRVRTDHRGALTMCVRTEDHDRALLYSIADAVREHTEMVGLLTEYADLVDACSAAERDGDWPRHRSLEDEIEDKLGELDALMSEAQVGEDMRVSASVRATEALTDALCGEEVAA